MIQRLILYYLGRLQYGCSQHYFGMHWLEGATGFVFSYKSMKEAKLASNRVTERVQCKGRA